MRKVNPCPSCGSSNVDVESDAMGARMACSDCDHIGHIFVHRHKHHGAWASDYAKNRWTNQEIENGIHADNP